VLPVLATLSSFEQHAVSTGKLQKPAAESLLHPIKFRQMILLKMLRISGATNLKMV
jgi:hypothetical protein